MTLMNWKLLSLYTIQFNKPIQFNSFSSQFPFQVDVSVGDISPSNNKATQVRRSSPGSFQS